MKTAPTLLRTGVFFGIIGDAFQARNPKINQEPWHPMNSDVSHGDIEDKVLPDVSPVYSGPKQDRDENKFSSRLSIEFSEDYDPDEYREVLKLLHSDNDDDEVSSSDVALSPQNYPDREVINILPQVVERADVVSVLQWLSRAERTLGDALRRGEYSEDWDN